MPTNTSYNPQNINYFEKSKLNFNGMKAKGEVPAGQTANIDLTLIEDHLLTGAIVDISGNHKDDEIKLKIMNGETELMTFIDWYARTFNKELTYPAKIPAGLTIRLEYKSAGTEPVSVRANYSLHRVLV